MPNPLNFGGYDFKLSQREFEVTLFCHCVQVVSGQQVTDLPWSSRGPRHYYKVRKLFFF